VNAASAQSGSWRRNLRLVLVLALRIGAIVEGIDGWCSLSIICDGGGCKKEESDGCVMGR
jgi:hypothetical protein